jgi:hypothetical protein
LGATFVVNSEPHRGLFKTFSRFYWKHETYGESARTRIIKGAEREKDGMAAMPPRKKHVPADPCFKVSLLATIKSKWSPKEHKCSPKAKRDGSAPAHTWSELRRKRGRGIVVTEVE